MTSPLISVVMPAYNCAATIEKAIDSALMQEVDLEVLVINDCSPEDLDSVKVGRHLIKRTLKLAKFRGRVLFVLLGHALLEIAARDLAHPVADS